MEIMQMYARFAFARWALRLIDKKSIRLFFFFFCEAKQKRGECIKEHLMMIQGILLFMLHASESAYEKSTTCIRKI